MLVLTRKLNETIRIGDNITITIVRVKGRAVGVGIDAPRDIRVSRGEIAGTPPNGSANGSAAASEKSEDTNEEPVAKRVPSPAVITEALRLVLDAEDHDTHGEAPATLHQVIHRRMRRSDDKVQPESRLPRSSGRMSLRDFLPSR